MPLLKIYADKTIEAGRKNRLAAALPALRELVCRELKVDASMCQIGIVDVHGLEDQTRISVEIQLLPKPERTHDVIVAVAGKIRDLLAEESQEHVAVRVTAIDPETYVVLR